ncbi:MAG: MBL fold metallo-hydrolase [Deltaproteobacteria bacterium]|nr:MBL fold metallo-hydrolase [Deltaproteobacteria bacterium]
MRVTFLGTGTSVPSLERSSSSVLIEPGESKILIDMGAGVMRRLLERGVQIGDLSHIFFSHFHLDHCGEFASFLFATKYGGFFPSREPFVVIGARGLHRFYDKLREIHGHWVDMEGRMTIIELDAGKTDGILFDDFEAFSRPMIHTPDSLGYRIIDRDGRSVTYSGDTDISDELVALARGTDLFVCESSFPDKMKRKGHLTPSEAGTIATAAGVKKLVLTHFYPEIESIDIRGQCRKTYRGPLLIARDLMACLVE